VLSRTERGSLFRYTDEFLASSEERIALHLPKTTGGILTEGLANLPSFFAGLLPEGVMLDAIVRKAHTSRGNLFEILAATGADAIGDVTIGRPPTPGVNSVDAAIDLLTEFIDTPLSSMEGIAAIPGVQPKLSIGSAVKLLRYRTERRAFIVKLSPPQFPMLAENEHFSMSLARRCGLNVARTSLRRQALLVERFDLVFEAGTMHRIHIEDTLQIMDRYPADKYAVDFDEICSAVSGLKVSPAVILDFLRQFVFSYLVGNGDLHAKNLSLMYDRSTKTWRSSPAYHIVSTLPYSTLSGSDRMAIALADESFGRYSRAEFVSFGSRFGLPPRVVNQMVSWVADRFTSALGRLDPPDVFDSRCLYEMRSRAVELRSGPA